MATAPKHPDREGTSYPSLISSEVTELARDHGDFIADALGTAFRTQVVGSAVSTETVNALVAQAWAKAPGLIAATISRGTRGEFDEATARGLAVWQQVTALGGVIGATIRDLGLPKLQSLIANAVIARSMAGLTAANDRLN